MTETKLLVAAIDFGSSGTGYAFSFGYQYTANPIDIYTSVWNDNNSMVSSKVPSFLLFDPDKKFDSFGFKAEEKYEDLCNSDHQDEWYYFKGFKMQLYIAVENEEDVLGKKMSAKTVFSAAIRYLKDHLIGEIQSRNLGAIEDMIYWVLSIPAIWSDSCKQFMRESAEMAGIKGDKFSMVFEPEAASVFAKLLPVDRFVGHNSSIMLKTFDSGKKFIVLDAGDVSAIMMVGGFSESDILQKAVKDEFPEIEVYIPLDGSLAILKGAVIYGHNSNIVSSRVSNLTYGVRLYDDFDPSIHDLEKFAIVDGNVVCKDIFTILYTIDEEVKVGESRSIDVMKTYETDEMQEMRCEPIMVDFYSSTEPNPFYTTDDGCRLHATIIVDPPSGGQWPIITEGRVELEISGTEMIGNYVFNDTGERTAVRYEFLPTKSLNPDRKRIFDPFNVDV